MIAGYVVFDRVIVPVPYSQVPKKNNQKITTVVLLSWRRFGDVINAIEKRIEIKMQ